MDAREIWLKPYLSIQGTYDTKILMVLNSAAASAAKAVKGLAGKEGIGATVRRAQLTQIETALHRIMHQLFKDVGDITSAGQHLAAARALSAGFDWDSILLHSVYGSDPKRREVMRRNLVAQAPRNIEALIIRLRRGGLPLSQQVYRSMALSQGWVNAAISNALGRGASWSELANDVRKFIDPATPGGVSYAAKRLARTEINNAYHAVAIQDMAGKPWVKQVQWRLSNSHSKLDICNVYASRKYTPQDVPAKPHPQCFCYVVPVLISSREFLAAWQAGRYDDYLAATYGKAAA